MIYLGSDRNLNPTHPLNQGVVADIPIALGYSLADSIRDTSAFSNNVLIVGASSTVSLGMSPENFLSLNLGNDTSAAAYIPGSSLLSLSGDFTMSALIHMTARNSSYRNILRKDAGSGAAAGYWLWRIETDNKILYNNAGGSVKSTTALSLNTTYHICVTRIGSTVTHYIDGLADGTPGTNAGSPTGTQDIRIGRLDSYSEQFVGFISNIRLYSGRGLLADEIWQLYVKTITKSYDLYKTYTPKLRLLNRLKPVYVAPPPPSTGRVKLVGPGLVGGNPLITCGGLVK